MALDKSGVVTSPASAAVRAGLVPAKSKPVGRKTDDGVRKSKCSGAVGQERVAAESVLPVDRGKEGVVRRAKNGHCGTGVHHARGGSRKRREGGVYMQAEGVVPDAESSGKEEAVGQGASGEEGEDRGGDGAAKGVVDAVDGAGEREESSQGAATGGHKRRSILRRAGTSTKRKRVCFSQDADEQSPSEGAKRARARGKSSRGDVADGSWRMVSAGQAPVGVGEVLAVESDDECARSDPDDGPRRKKGRVAERKAARSQGQADAERHRAGGLGRHDARGGQGGPQAAPGERVRAGGGAALQHAGPRRGDEARGRRNDHKHENHERDARASERKQRERDMGDKIKKAVLKMECLAGGEHAERRDPGRGFGVDRRRATHGSGGGCGLVQDCASGGKRPRAGGEAAQAAAAPPEAGAVPASECGEAATGRESKLASFAERFPPMLSRSAISMTVMTDELAKSKVAYGNVLTIPFEQTGVEPDEFSEQPHIVNVAATFRLGVNKINRRALALSGIGACYNSERFKSVTLAICLRDVPYKPTMVALIFESGRVVMTGARTKEQGLMGAHALVHLLRTKCGMRTAGVYDFRLRNLVALVDVGFQVDVPRLSKSLGTRVQYQPERFPPARYRRRNNKKTVALINQSGRVVASGCRSHEDCTDFIIDVHQKCNRFRSKTGAAISASDLRLQHRKQAGNMKDLMNIVDGSRVSTQPMHIAAPPALKMIMSASGRELLTESNETNRQLLMAATHHIMDGVFE